ncbi:MAG: hypothetical protein HUU49_02575 [Candidatus Buchananbacteria bacterium]|nr:hypothetical protein [Candidatus Buchananbacteria bacterium]
MYTTKPKGYIALIALLIVAVAGLAIGLSISLSGVDELQSSFSSTQAAIARNLANACIEDGLERLRNNFVDYVGTLSIGSNSCILTVEVSGNIATVTATGTVDTYHQKIEIQVDNNLAVISWQEE